MIRAFTGPTVLTTSQRLWAAKAMLSYPDAEVWRSGAAFGIDSLAARLARALDKQLALYIPAARYNRHLVEQISGSTQVLVVKCFDDPNEYGIDHSRAYRHRNKMMMSGADHLVAFVHDPEFYRSGEWMTINIAKRLGIQTSIEVLPGS